MVQLPLDGITVAVTGASGSLGQALLRQLHREGATLVALTSREEPLQLSDADGRPIPLRQVVWRCGEEGALEPVLADCQLLVINHGFNSHGDRSTNAVEASLEVNALSSWRLLELFARLAQADPPGHPRRELWMNTSEAEIQAAVSPLYELSKRLQGQLLSLRSLDLAGPQLRIRRLVLGPFRSALNPIGVMGAGFVAREILRQVHWNCSLVIVTPNPLTYVLMPLATLSRWLYFSLTSRPSAEAPAFKSRGR
jgi:NAD(P)-dependent dehydrogenase (short-subunit alcohol dehydrogenase family)